MSYQSNVSVLQESVDQSARGSSKVPELFMVSAIPQKGVQVSEVASS